MTQRDPFHDSIVHTDAATAASGERGRASEIVTRLGGRPRLEGRYEIHSEVGRGAMGAVMRVWDADLRRQLAVKVMIEHRSSNESQTASQESATARRYARFLEEAQITGQLDHPGIVPVHEIGLDQRGQLYFTMKLVKGRDLREVFELVRKGEEGWNRTRALNVLLRVCEAMTFAHSKGVIHRDLKPGNVMVGRYGEVYVMDWGLAKVLGEKDTHDVRLRRPDASQSLVRTERRDCAKEADSPLATMDGDIVGTPCYMPPEQARGRLEDIGPHSDVYSVGAILYELLSGHMPYCAHGDRPSPQAVLGALMQGPPKPLRELVEDLPDELVAICDKAMAREISARYPTMSGLTEDLRAYLEGRVVRAYETGALAEIRKWLGRNWPLAATIGAALVIGIGSLYGMLALAQLKNAELEAKQQELQDNQQALQRNQDELQSKQDELEQVNLTLTEQKAAVEAKTHELEALNEQLAAAGELAKRKSYAAGIAAADASLKINDVAAARARLLDKYNEQLRAWEWVHLWARCDGSVRTLSQFSSYAGAPTMATHVATDARGRVLAVCGQDSLSRQSAAGVVRVLEIQRRNELVEIQVEGGPLEALAVSPDGKRVALAGADDVVRLYELPSATPYAQWQGPRSSNHRASLAFTPDLRELIACLAERSVAFLSVENAQPAREIRERIGMVNAIDVSSDGARLALGVDEGQVYVFDLATLRQLDEIGERGASVRSVAFSPDGERLIASTGLGRGADPRRGPWLFTVREWEIESGRLVSTWQDHQASVNWCDYAAGGRLVVSVSDDRSVRVRDTLRGDAWSMLGHVAAIGAGALTSDGDMLVSGGVDGAVREWSPWLGEFASLAGHRRPIHSLHFLDDAERLLSVAVDGGVRLWDARSTLLLAVLQSSGDPGADRNVCWAVAPSAPLCAVAAANGAVRVWDTERAQFVATLESGERERMEALAFSSDSRWLAAVGERAIGYVWRLDAPGEAPAALRGARGQGVRLAWIDDDRGLALGSTWLGPTSSSRTPQRFSEVNVFDVSRRVSTRLLENLPGALLTLEPSPDGEELLLAWRQGGERGAMRRVDARSLDARGSDLVLDFEHAMWFGEGRRIVVADSEAGVQLIDPDSGEIELALHAAMELGAVAVSPDGQRIAAGYADGSIRVWSSEAPLQRHTRRLAAVRARGDALRELEKSIRSEGLTAEAALEQLESREDAPPELLSAARDVVRLLRGERARLVGEVRETCRSARREPNDYALALLQATMLSRAAPQAADGAYCVGLALLRLGRFGEAEPCFRAAMASVGSDRAPGETHALLALAMLRSRRRDEAQREFDAYRKSRSLFEGVILDPSTRDLMVEVEAAFDALAPR